MRKLFALCITPGIKHAYAASAPASCWDFDYVVRKSVTVLGQLNDVLLRTNQFIGSLN